MPKSRFLYFLCLLVIFLSGALCGVFGYRLYNTSAAGHNPQPGPTSNRKAAQPDTEEIRKRIVEEMRQRVKLDDAQVAKLNRIFDDTRARFDQIHREMNERGHAAWDHQVAEVKAILRPDQVPLYDQLRAEHEAARKRRHAQEADKK
jgi:endonuclease YncB( thermonuclease family)